jgi:3-methylfumaryl-CoA hydratase
MHRQSEIGADGHAKRGGFLPPVPLPRRMWAGSQFEFRSPIRVGDRGRAHVHHRRRHDQGGPHRQAGVRQGAPRGALQRRPIPRWSSSTTSSTAKRSSPARSPAAAEAGRPRRLARQIVPDDVLLFRYSALTFNGHRIHYDRQYVTRSRATPASSCTAR